MKGAKLGVLGLGSQTTAFYLKELNRAFNRAKGGYSTCPFVLLNTNFDAINQLLPHVSKELDAIVQTSISELESMNVGSLLIPNITLSETVDRLKLKTPVLHPVAICVAKLKEHNSKKVVLFGSLHTMQSNYIQTHFAKNNIEVILPSKEGQLFIDQVRKHVYAETQTEELLQDYHLMIEKYSLKHPVVLACTELSIFKSNQKNVLDMAQLQIENAVKTIL